MALNSELGKKMLQLLTSRYNDRHWRKKIEKTLSLPATGVADPAQRQVFLYFKESLKAYKSRRADPDSWLVGGYATQEAIGRAKFNPAAVGPSITNEDVSYLGQDPGPEVDPGWWEDMLVAWFEDAEETADETLGQEDEAAATRIDPNARPPQR